MDVEIKINTTVELFKIILTVICTNLYFKFFLVLGELLRIELKLVNLEEEMALLVGQ